MPAKPPIKLTAAQKKKALEVLLTPEATLAAIPALDPKHAEGVAAEMSRDLIFYEEQLRSAMSQAGSPPLGPSLAEYAPPHWVCPSCR